jgi:hypothetical protein
MSNFKDIKIDIKCDHSPSYGLDDTFYSWELVYGEIKVKLEGNSCYTDGYVIREKDIRGLLGEINQEVRKKLFLENPNIFYKICDMNQELKKLAMEIPEEINRQLINKRKEILSLIKKYEQDMERVLKKRVKFSLYHQEF